MEACCTCATLLSEVPRYSKSEKPLPDDRRLDCCARTICGNCIHNNPRFGQYCPYCQTSSAPSSLPRRLREPPSYSTAAADPSAPALSSAGPPPPPYTPRAAAPLPLLDPEDEKTALALAASLDAAPQQPPAEDTLHFLDHARDSVASLSLRYGVPPAALRRANKLTSDHLLPARRTVVIPGEFYRAGVSLSPRPVEGEEEELRKGKIRRWMVACKEADYEVAVLYLEQAAYDVDAATEAYFADEAWEKAHPLEEASEGARSGGGGRKGKLKGKGKTVTGHRASQAAFLRRA